MNIMRIVNQGIENLIGLPLKSLSNNQTVKVNLSKTFPESNSHQIEEWIKKGEALETKLTKISQESDESKRLSLLLDHASPENAVALMWLLTAKTAYYNQEFRNGAIRQENGKIINEFFKSFNNVQLNGGPILYSRISTHMKENIGKSGTIKADEFQWGLDLKNLGLPANKHTILFALQPDGSLYIKMEERGYPPCWKKGYCTWNNLIEDLGHWGTFITSRFEKSSGTAKKKEHVPEKIKKEFEHTMKLLFPPEEKSFFARLFSRKQIMSEQGELQYKEGLKFGAFMMNAIVDARIKELNGQVVVAGKKFTAIGPEFYETNRQRGESEFVTLFRNPSTIPVNYGGKEFKGEEVLLPALGKPL